MIKKTLAPLLRAQAEIKRKTAQLKEASTALDSMLEWSNTYLQAPDTLPRKDWICTQNDKVQIRMKIQSKDKLVKDVEKMMFSYEHLIIGIDSMVEVHHIPSLGALDIEKTREEVTQDIQTFLQPIRQEAASQDLPA